MSLNGIERGLSPLDYQKVTTGLADATLTIPTAVATYVKQTRVYGLPTRQIKVTLSSCTVAVVDNGTTGSGGGTKICSLPEGAILMLPAVASFPLGSISVGTGAVATASMYIALGTAAAATSNFTLGSTEADIIAQTATGVMAAAATTASVTAVGANVHTQDGTAAAKDIYLNVCGVGADDTTTNVTVTVSGTIILNYIALGDK